MLAARKQTAQAGASKMQQAAGAASIAASILLFLVFVLLVYDLIAGYAARRRFARLLALRKFWLRQRSNLRSAPAAVQAGRVEGRAFSDARRVPSGKVSRQILSPGRQ
jgi:uncharacterized membrane protein YtjA (UPF0391 family)